MARAAGALVVAIAPEAPMRSFSFLRSFYGIAYRSGGVEKRAALKRIASKRAAKMLDASKFAGMLAFPPLREGLAKDES